ncbi:MAG: hypothetical protein KatS3mg103_0403 [Phycisphaerales bacterium]|nr:MAG: hypothetical protein KatS3mg103_0403 [Phycisphaerales bacterium]
MPSRPPRVLRGRAVVRGWAGVLALALVCCLVLGCAHRSELPVTLTFRNVRAVVVQGESSAGSPRVTRSEWDQIWPVVVSHHKVGNRMAMKPSFDAGPPTMDAIAGVEVRDYTASIVVDGFSGLSKLHRSLESLKGQPIAPGRRLQLSLSEVALGFSGNFISARRTEMLQGRTLPGATVVLYDRDPDRPRIIRADANGQWMIPIVTSPGQRSVVGYSVPPGVRDRPETRRYFRIDLNTNVGEDIDQRRFNSEIDAMRGGVSGLINRITG